MSELYLVRAVFSAEPREYPSMGWNVLWVLPETGQAEGGAVQALQRF